MITTLPDLSYRPTGIIWSDLHSPAIINRQAYPRTDLQQFLLWHEFATDIHNAITAYMGQRNILPGAQYDIGSLPKKPKKVQNEEGVRHEASNQLHDLVEEVLEILGIDGGFKLSASWNNQILGAPDFAWLQNNVQHPLLVAEYKTKWAAPLADLPGYFNKQDRSVLERQSIDAVYQVYGYMTFNDNKYGILTNMQHAWFFQRVEGGQTLRYYGPIGIDPASSPSMLKAFVGIILLANDSWFNSSPTLAHPPPGQHFGPSPTAARQRATALRQAHHYRSEVVAGSYDVLQLDPRLCHFDRSSIRHDPRHGFTLKAQLETGMLTREDVFCKVVDLFRAQDSIDSLDTEVRNYATLKDLQGIAIPRVCGYYDIWGLLRVFVLEDVGTAISEDQQIDGQMRMGMKAALSRIHSAGFIHGDIARRNFCMKGNAVFLVDLETLVLGTLVERMDELAAIDAL